MRTLLLVMVFLAALSALLLANRACLADNPIIQTKYTADPAPLVFDDTVYLYTTHDEDDAEGFTMYDWLLYSSTDMVNWTDHGIVAGVREPNKTFGWADGYNAWAPQVIRRNGRFYLYGPLPRSGHMVIGVAVADSPTGPFVDAIGAPLIQTESTHDIDPTVFIDDDGQAYLYWGHQHLYYVRLNEDMTSYSGEVVELPRPDLFEEGPWLWKRNDLYYLAFASYCCPEGIGYATSDGPTGPWTSRGHIMEPTSVANGNHPGIVDYKGLTYVFGFSWELLWARQTEHAERRSVSVDVMSYAADGTIPTLPFWSEEGPPQIETLDPYVRTEAETIAWAWEVKTEPCSEGGMNVTAIENGDYIKVKGVDFGAGATSFEARVASAGGGGTIEIRLDSQTGTLVGTCAVSTTGDAQTWVTESCPISDASEVHDLYFVFTGGDGPLFNFDWWQFAGPGEPGTGGAGGAGGHGGAAGSGGSAAGGTAGVGGSAGAPDGGSAGEPVVGAGGTVVGSGGMVVGSGGMVVGSGGAVVGAGGVLVTGGSNGAGGAQSSGGSWNTGGSSSSDVDAGLEGSGASSDEGGCGCFVVARRSSSGSLATVGVLGLLALRLSRRRPKLALRSSRR